MNPEPQGLLAHIYRLGAAIAKSPLHQYFFGTEEGRATVTVVVLALLALGVWAGWTLWRRSSWLGMQMMYSQPLKMKRWHGAWRGPLFVLAGACFVVLVVPVYLQRMEAFRPGPWPNIGSLEPSFGLVALVVGAVLGLLALVVGLRRTLREKVLKSPHGTAAWASRSEVVVDPKAPVMIPLLVHYRGAYGDWLQGAGETKLKGVVKTIWRFTPKINQAALVPLAPSAQTIWEMVILYGMTGSGKGLGIFGPVMKSAIQISRRTGEKIPFIYQDFKSECPYHDELWELTGEEPIRFGAASTEGWPSMRFNFIKEALSDPNPEDAINSLVGLIMPNKDKGDFVAPASRPLLGHVISTGRYETLKSIRDAVRDEGLLKVLEQCKTPAGYMSALEGKNMLQYCTDCFLTSLHSFSSGWGGRVTSGHDFTLDDFLRRGGYVLSAESSAELTPPIKIFWQMLLRRAMKSTKELKCLLLFDEALAAGPIPNVQDALVTLRNRKVSIWFGVQHRAGLKSVYGPVDGEAVISSFKNRIWLFNGMNDDDTKHLLGMLGNRTYKIKEGKTTRYVGGPLISLEDFNARKRRESDYWGIFEVLGTVKGESRTLLGKVVPTTGQIVRPPTPEERAEALQRYGGDALLAPKEEPPVAMPVDPQDAPEAPADSEAPEAVEEAPDPECPDCGKALVDGKCPFCGV